MKSGANETPKERQERLSKLKDLRIRNADIYSLSTKIWHLEHPKQSRAIQKRYTDRQVSVKFRRGSTVKYHVGPVSNKREGSQQCFMTGTISDTKKGWCEVERIELGNRVTEWVPYKRLTLIWQAPPGPSPLELSGNSG